MRLLVADKLMREPLEELEVLGIEIVHSPGLTPETLPDALDDLGIVVVRSTTVTAAASEPASTSPIARERTPLRWRS